MIPKTRDNTFVKFCPVPSKSIEFYANNIKEVPYTYLKQVGNKSEKQNTQFYLTLFFQMDSLFLKMYSSMNGYRW